jgi:triosephosphate isomerase
MPRAWTRRPRLVAGNWKMHRTASEAVALARDVVARLDDVRGCEVALCPPYTSLESVADVLHGTPIHLGAQNLHPESHGAFTGEIAGTMLAAVGCRFVIVGHSERRHGLGEDDALVARKLRAALRDGLTPIVCVGETLSEREAGRTSEVLVRQVSAAYQGLGVDDALGTVVAYEPVWAIGTGRTASPQQAQEVHAFLRARLLPETRVLYGGSVKPANAAAMFEMPDVDGGLIGGASLVADEFLGILRAAQRKG